MTFFSLNGPFNSSLLLFHASRAASAAPAMLSESIPYSLYRSLREPDCPNSVTPNGKIGEFSALPIHDSE